MRLLRNRFETMSDGGTTPQERGILFEQLMNQWFKLEGILAQNGFKRNEGGEQIDGSFELDGWYYLVECKWQSEMTSAKEVDGLLGKLGRSGVQALGVFISVNGWSSHVVPLMKQNSDKRIFLVNGEDIRQSLSGKVGLVEMLRTKKEALNLSSEPYASVPV